MQRSIWDQALYLPGLDDDLLEVVRSRFPSLWRGRTLVLERSRPLGSSLRELVASDRDVWLAPPRDLDPEALARWVEEAIVAVRQSDARGVLLKLAADRVDRIPELARLQEVDVPLYLAVERAETLAHERLAELRVRGVFLAPERPAGAPDLRAEIEAARARPLPKTDGRVGVIVPPDPDDAAAAFRVAEELIGSDLVDVAIVTVLPETVRKLVELDPSASLDALSPPPKAEASKDVPPAPARRRRRLHTPFAPDLPIGEDRLGYEVHAEALASILANPRTNPPVTIALYGPWGVGKSFFFGLLDKHIKKHSPQNAEQSLWRRLWFGRSEVEQRGGLVDFHTISFNAWVYSGTENLWAGLVTHLYDGIEAYVGPWRSRWFRFRRTWQKRILRPLLFIVFYGALSSLFWWLLGFESLGPYLGQDPGQQRQDLEVGWKTLLGGGIVTGIVVVLVTLPKFIGAVRELVGSIVTSRAAELAALASRRDFRDRIGFMADVKSEIKEINQLLEGVQRRTGGTVRPLRIIVFIDDLDRCPPAKAVEVLEAIMLLLADDDASHFVVVLGLDARVVVRAIEEKYGEVLVRAGVSGYEYLDKLVQVPFGIPAAGAQLYEYLRSLLERPGAPAREAASPSRSVQPVPSASGAARPANSNDALPPASGERAAAPVTSPETLQSAPTAAQELVEQPFTQDELDAFGRCRAFLPPNPRRLKRLVNVYRLARMLHHPPEEEDSEVLVRWMIFTERWPVRASLLLWQLEQLRPRSPASFHDAVDLMRPRLESPAFQELLHLDADGTAFDRFLEAMRIDIAVAEDLASRMFNVNPAIRQDVERAARASTPAAPTEQREPPPVAVPRTASV